MGSLYGSSLRSARRPVADHIPVALRYTLSSCMFGYPTERVSISSPCQVTCQPLNVSVAHGISNDTSDADPGLDFCSADQFDDTTINNCAFCYSFIPQQLFIANCMYICSGSYNIY